MVCNWLVAGFILILPDMQLLIGIIKTSGFTVKPCYVGEFKGLLEVFSLRQGFGWYDNLSLRGGLNWNVVLLTVDHFQWSLYMCSGIVYTNHAKKMQKVA